MHQLKSIHLTSVMVITVVAVLTLLAFSVSAQAQEVNEAKHCVTHLSPVAEGSGESSQSTSLGCYETFEEAISVAHGPEDHQSASSERVSSAKGNHCVTHLSPVPADSLESSKSNSLGCYETFTEAISVATNGVVKLSSDISPQNLTQEMLEARGMGSASSDVVIGIDYDAPNFPSWRYSHTYTAPEPCTPGAGYAMSSMPSGWNDAVSSAEGYSECHKFIHYKDINYNGTSITCDMNDTCDYMGIMNNETSSLRWRY